MPAARVRRVIRTYRDSQTDRQAITRARVEVQTQRAIEIVKRLQGLSRTVVLDDPVGTGKTVVALAAINELFQLGEVTKALIVCPNKEIARRWHDRAKDAGLPIIVQLVGGTKGVRTVSVRGLSDIRVPSNRSRLLVVVDEAHRGLHNPHGEERRRIARVASGARVLLITATPWQMSADGLRNMLTVGLDQTDPELEPMHRLGRASAALVRAQYLAASGESGERGADSALHRAESEYAAASTAAHEIRRKVFLPTYDRQAAGLPERFAVPEASSVIPAPDWELAFHVARLLPELSNRNNGDRVRNSDMYMRMLTSSHAALFMSAVWRGFEHDRRHTAKELRQQIHRKFRAPHPKVSFTADEALRRTDEGRHVLVFCYFKATPGEIKERLARQMRGSGTRVRVAQNETHAREALKAGFGGAVTADNPPMVLIAGDALSESVDLDGGRPVVIHHDLTWAPTDYDQRMGRVVRIRSGFQNVAQEDIVIPVLGSRDNRMYETLKARRDLADLALAPAI